MIWNAARKGVSALAPTSVPIARSGRATRSVPDQCMCALRRNLSAILMQQESDLPSCEWH